MEVPWKRTLIEVKINKIKNSVHEGDSCNGADNVDNGRKYVYRIKESGGL